MRNALVMVMNRGFGGEVGKDFASIMHLIAVVILLNPAQVSCGGSVDGVEERRTCSSS